jgi:predicted nucleic acid-binding Zn ribbon protein
MPTYEFRLADGTIIERIFKISEVPDEIPNPNGEGTAVRIISGGAALLFKGTGFYLTDYGRNAHRTQGDAPKPKGGDGAASGGGESGSSKSDASGSSSGGAEGSGNKGGHNKGGDNKGGDNKSGGNKSSSSAGDAKPSAPATSPNTSTSKSTGSGPAAS